MLRCLPCQARRVQPAWERQGRQAQGALRATGTGRVKGARHRARQGRQAKGASRAPGTGSVKGARHRERQGRQAQGLLPENIVADRHRILATHGL